MLGTSLQAITLQTVLAADGETIGLSSGNPCFHASCPTATECAETPAELLSLMRLQRLTNPPRLSRMQGKALTATVRGIHAEFAAAAEALQKAAYDPLDMSVAQFDVDHAHFCNVTAELERRLSAIITQVQVPCCCESLCVTARLPLILLDPSWPGKGTSCSQRTEIGGMSMP